MHARSLALLGATLVAVGCSTDGPATAPAPTGGTSSPVAEKVPVPPSSGVLNLCLVSGAGLSTGQLFTSSLTLAGVTRSITNKTGDCAPLEVPRESTPQGKGWFATRPSEIARVLPGSSTLVVDGANPSAADVLAILNGAPNVQASSSLLLNLAQQLIAAELNVLRGVQASALVKQAIIDANAGIKIDIASKIEITTTLTNAQVSALVATLAGFNEGKTKPPASPTSVDVDVVQGAVKNLEVASIACVPLSSCFGGSLLLGRITTTVKSGEETKVTYTNQSKPILQMCVVGGQGAPTDLALHFDGLAPGFGFVSFDVPTGECREQETSENMSYELTGTTQAAGVRLASIDCDPSTLCGTKNLEYQTVTATVNRGVTTVTVTTRSALGTIKICKVAGPGLATDKKYAISAQNDFITSLPGEPIIADAKLLPGECFEKQVLEGEDYEVREFEDFINFTLSSITCEPSTRCGGQDLSRHSTFADIVASSTTTINFTNRSTLGTLKVCIQNGGVPVPSSFLIDVSPYDVAAGPGEPSSASPTIMVGQCYDVTLKEGTYTVSQSPSGPGFLVDAINCNPTERCSGFFTTSVKAQVIAASTTTVTFTETFAEGRVAGARGVPLRSP
jgi:hypothetical protein